MRYKLLDLEKGRVYRVTFRRAGQAEQSFAGCYLGMTLSGAFVHETGEPRLAFQIRGSPFSRHLLDPQIVTGAELAEEAVV